MQLDFFTDRLEIHSPGGLYGRTTVEELGHSRPDLRNPALAVMADTLTDAENRYSGIPTIRREMAAYSLPEPLFENRRGEFVVTLRHSMEPAEPSCDGAQTDLLSYCTVPRTRQEIAAFLGIKTASYAIRHTAAGGNRQTEDDDPGSPGRPQANLLQGLSFRAKQNYSLPVILDRQAVCLNEVFL